MLNHIRLYLLIACLCIISISCKQEKKQEKQKTKPTVQVTVMCAGNQTISNSIHVSGTVQANEMVDLHPEVSGRITYLNIPDGAKVTEGTILARINDADLQAQLQQTKAQLSLAQAQEQRLQQLLTARGVSQAEYDAAYNEVLKIKAQLQVIQANIEKTIIRAPFSGTLGLRLVSPGAFVTPQTKLSTLMQTNPVKIDFQVPELYASSVTVGSHITCKTQDNKTYTATVQAIEPYIQTNTRNILVRAIITDAVLLPGTFVTIPLQQTKQAIVVPTNAIIPDANKNQLVLVQNGKAQFKTVETGIRTPEYVEIVKGISIGDTILVSGMLYVRPQERVIIKEVTHISMP